MSKIVLLEYYGPYFSRTFLGDMIVNWLCNKILSGKRFILDGQVWKVSSKNICRYLKQVHSSSLTGKNRE